MARTTAPLDQVDRIDAEAAARDVLYQEAERVMAQSKPTPTQKENDLYKVGALHPDDKEDPNNPEMPSVAEQQRRIAEGHAPASRQPERAERVERVERVERAEVPQRRSAEAAGGAPYMTRDATPRSQSAVPPHGSASRPSTTATAAKPDDKDAAKP